MEYLKKQDVINTINKFIEARKNKNCSKQVVIERTVFEYVLNIINTIPTIKIDEPSNDI